MIVNGSFESPRTNGFFDFPVQEKSTLVDFAIPHLIPIAIDNCQYAVRQRRATPDAQHPLGGFSDANKNIRPSHND